MLIDTIEIERLSGFFSSAVEAWDGNAGLAVQQHAAKAGSYPSPSLPQQQICYVCRQTFCSPGSDAGRCVACQLIKSRVLMMHFHAPYQSHLTSTWIFAPACICNCSILLSMQQQETVEVMYGWRGASCNYVLFASQ